MALLNLQYAFYLFHEMLIAECGPYLFVSANDFLSTSSRKLQRYWSDKSFGELVVKLKEQEYNQVLRDVLGNKGISLDALLSVCDVISKSQRIDSDELAHRSCKRESMAYLTSLEGKVEKVQDEDLKKNCKLILKFLNLTDFF